MRLCFFHTFSLWDLESLFPSLFRCCYFPSTLFTLAISYVRYNFGILNTSPHVSRVHIRHGDNFSCFWGLNQDLFQLPSVWKKHFFYSPHLRWGGETCLRLLQQVLGLSRDLCHVWLAPRRQMPRAHQLTSFDGSTAAPAWQSSSSYLKGQSLQLPPYRRGTFSCLYQGNCSSNHIPHVMKVRI